MFQTWMNVLAMFGGLTGLFLGFSLVTGYEIGMEKIFSALFEKTFQEKLFSVYFFTVRVLFDVIMKQKKKKKKVNAMKLVYDMKKF